MKKTLGLFFAALSLGAQTQITYGGTNVTGQLVLVRTVNPSLLGGQRALAAPSTSAAAVDEPGNQNVPEIFEEVSRSLRRLRPEQDPAPTAESLKATLTRSALGLQTVPGLPVVSVPGGFDGLTHLDQRNAGGGNQYNTEPSNPGVAIANGFVLLGVNNAVQVYNLTGTPLLPRVLTSNELFGVSPAIDRNTGINGVYPTDMRVFWDQGINRWFVLQRAQDYNAAGDPLETSRFYMAVSQTADPTAAYNIYVMETTDRPNPSCPCVADYPSIGADQHGFYISSNEFTSANLAFANAQIHAISKASLLSGVTNPVTFRIRLPFTTGYEFAIQPAITPPGASYAVGSGGVQFFVSTLGRAANDNKMGVFALVNTSTLATSNPNLSLIQITVPILPYVTPDPADQKSGPITRNASVSFIDGGDTRIQGVSYAGGRIFATLATAVRDTNGRQVVGGAFVIFSPTYRNGILAAPVLRQAYFSVTGNHLLRPSIAMNAQGRGAIAVTLVGPDYFPSAAYLPIDTFSGPTVVRLVKPGFSPQDGFTGDGTLFSPGTARWGDYSSPFIAPDGSFWMAVGYIPNLPRNPLANWGTYISRY
ncbi:MAG: hypothetical protein K2X03_12630 [Bryobacteraceae bacterium]|nr:hypothetical protein [Bryobacteraceae bacterium]